MTRRVVFACPSWSADDRLKASVAEYEKANALLAQRGLTLAVRTDGYSLPRHYAHFETYSLELIGIL
jgi:hypothetical protein